MLISRLAPVDYHRFHFPVDATLQKTKLIPGSLYSVSPIALKQMVNVLTENKRMLVEIILEERLQQDLTRVTPVEVEVTTTLYLLTLQVELIQLYNLI